MTAQCYKILLYAVFSFNKLRHFIGTGQYVSINNSDSDLESGF